MEENKEISVLWFKENVDDYYKSHLKPYGKFRALLAVPVGQKNQHKLLVHIEEEYGMIPIAYHWSFFIIEKKGCGKNY